MTAKVQLLTGAIDGVNTVFTAPDQFAPGSFRIIWNGVVYDPSDDDHGFAETGPNEITTTNPPLAGDVLQGFYQIGSGEHADGVATLAELQAIPQAQRVDRQIRLVVDQNQLYRFEVGATDGGIVPDDVDDGRWYQIGLQAMIGSPFHPQNTLP